MTPLALSISSEIKSIGAYAGFAAVVGLALLALLYFAQAREVRRLTEWAGRAPDRAVAPAPVGPPPAAGGLPGQPPPGSVQGIRPVGPARPQVPGQPPPPFAPPASPGRPPGPPPGLPGAAVSPFAQATAPGAGATQAMPSPVPSSSSSSSSAPASAPVGFPPPARPQAPGPPGYPPAPADGPPPPVGYPPPASPSFPPGPSVPPGTSRVPAAPVPVGVGVGGPRAQPLAGPPPASRPVADAPPRRPPAPQPDRPSGASADGRGSRPRTRPSRRRTLAVVAGAFVILVILVFAATRLLGGGPVSGSPRTNSVPGASSRSPGAASTSPAVAPSTVTVAVLNGTTVAGLAARIAKRLHTAGYLKGYVGDAPSKSAVTTSVEYALNEQPVAKQVARALGLSSTAVVPLDPATAAVSPTVSDAQVVVSVGPDLQK